jgi:DNA-binding NarL/FixJ family response regulator
MIRPSEPGGKPARPVNVERAKVLILDDHPFFSACLRLALESEPDFTVCRISRNGRDAQAELNVSRPDVLIIDVMLRGENGIDVARAIRSHDINTPIIFVSALARPARSATAGIARSVFVSKTESPQILLRTLRRLVRGPCTDEESGMHVAESSRLGHAN